MVEETDEILSRTSREMAEKCMLHGTPEQIADQLKPFMDEGVNWFSLTDFLGPRIDRLRLLDEMTDDGGGGPFGGIGEKPKLIEFSLIPSISRVSGS